MNEKFFKISLLITLSGLGMGQVFAQSNDRCQQSSAPAISAIGQAASGITLSQLSGGSFPSQIRDMVVIEKSPDFVLDIGALNAGKSQAYSALLKKSKLTKEESDLLNALDTEGVMKKKGDKVSIQKMAYIIPGASAEEFTPSLSKDAKFIEKTLKDTKSKTPKIDPSFVRYKKSLPVVRDVETEMKVSTSLNGESNEIAASHLEKYNGVSKSVGTPNRVTEFLLKDASPAYITSSQSVVQFFNLPDKSGLLMVQYTLASLDDNEMTMFENMGLKAVSDYQKEQDFIKASTFSIENTRANFSSKK